MKESIDPTIGTVVKHKCLLGEGPVWDDKKKLILWIDVLQGVIHQYSPQENEHKRIAVQQMIGCLAVNSTGDFIAALKEGFAFIDRRGRIKMVADPEANLIGNRFNDGKCDPAGRFFAGTMSLSGKQKAGSLYVLEKNLTVIRRIKDVSISNGIAWSPDHRTFYHVDTPSFEVNSYDYDIKTGNIKNKKVVIKIPEYEGAPDGMTIDDEGKLWIAHWDGWQVARWDPISGKKLTFFRLPVSRVTSCTFGGNDLGDLYITSARVGLVAEELRQQPLAGSLFLIKKCGFKGMKAFEFKRGHIDSGEII